jgi:carbon monoxide dehydrogenase subunit G
MARYETEYRETFVVDLPAAVVRAHFGDVARIAENLESVERAEPLGNGTLAVTMAPLSKHGVTFHGRYRCRYVFTGEDELQWTPEGDGNVWMSGRARFTAEAPRRTRVDFLQNVAIEMDINFLLAALARPIVTAELEKQIRRYLERTRRALGATA